MILDKLDQKILFELFRNARTPNSELAKKLSTSKEVIQYRIKRLQEQSIITKFIPIINFSRVGYTIYRIQLKFTNKNIPPAIEFFRNIPQTSWIVELQGNWDLVVLFWIKQPTEIFTIINTIKAQFQDAIQQLQLTMVSTIYYCAPDYLSSEMKQVQMEPVHSRVYYTMKTELSEPCELTELQKKLLEQLQHNARESLLAIAKTIGSSATNVQYHFKQLLTEKIILGFIPLLDHTKLGYTHFKLTLNLVNPAQADTLKQLLLQMSNVIYVTESYGYYDLEFECVMKNIQNVFSLLNTLTEKYPFKSHEIIYNNKEIVVNEFPYGKIISL